MKKTKGYFIAALGGLSLLSAGAVNVAFAVPVPSHKPLMTSAVTEAKVAVKPLSLGAAIEQTLKTNPELRSLSKNVDFAEEEIDLAKSDYRPDVAANAGITHLQSDNDLRNSWESNTSKTIGLSVSQPIYRGGRTAANINEQTALKGFAENNFDNDIQNKVLDVVTVYMNVIQAREALDVNLNNKNLLQERLNATNAGFEAGELTRTDMSQAESRFAQAEAEYVAAKANLDIALSDFRQVTGIMDPVELAYPDLDQGVLPVTLDDALYKAESDNPFLKAFRERVKAANYNVDEQQGAFLPEVSLGGAVDVTDQPISGAGLYDREETATLSLTASLPLYQKGIIRNRLRQAHIAKAQREADLEDVRRQVVDAVISAWETYQSSASRIKARRAQVEAARIALDGIDLERQVGTRSVLDVLDANQDLKDAELSLIDARSNAVSAHYNLLAAIGQLLYRD